MSNNHDILTSTQWILAVLVPSDMVTTDEQIIRSCGWCTINCQVHIFQILKAASINNCELSLWVCVSAFHVVKLEVIHTVWLLEGHCPVAADTFDLGVL